MTTVFKKTADLQEEGTCRFQDEIIGALNDSVGSAEDCIKTESGETEDKLEDFLLDDENLEYLSDIKMELSDDDSAGKLMLLLSRL